MVRDMHKNLIIGKKDQAMPWPGLFEKQERLIILL